MAKPEPDYSASDDFQVELSLSAVVEDKSFYLFIRYIQQERAERDEDRLSVQEVLILNKIR
jgi:ATP-dependent DNA helicase RecG